MPGVSFTELLSGRAERLAWIAGRDEMNAAAPRPAIEGFKVVPDRRLTQRLVRHPGHESRRCMAFPLDETHSAVSRFGNVKSEVEPSVSGAERKASEVVLFRHEAGR